MWYHTIDPYTPEQLRDIFISKLKQSNWKWSDDVYETMLQVIRSNPHLFQDNAGSIENFITLLKIKHSNRVVLLDESLKKVITSVDIQNSVKSSKKENNESYMSMYM